MSSLLDQEKYRHSFDPQKYLETFYRTPEEHRASTRVSVSFYKTLRSNDLRLLEFGGGPALIDVLLAVPKCKEIVFTDYSDRNLQEVQRWLDKDPDAFDWSPFTRMVLEEEGLQANPEAIRTREEDLRRAITTVAHCDIGASPPVEEKLCGPYDVVHCDGVLEAVCETVDQFFTAVNTLSKLVKKGDGHLIVAGGTNLSHSYNAGTEFCTPLKLQEQDYLNAFQKAGLFDIQTKVMREVYKTAGFEDRTFFVTGTRP